MESMRETMQKNEAHAADHPLMSHDARRRTAPPTAFQTQITKLGKIDDIDKLNTYMIIRGTCKLLS